jgi:hypothetical protein
MVNMRQRSHLFIEPFKAQKYQPDIYNILHYLFSVINVVT